MTEPRPSIDDVAAALDAATPRLTPEQQRLVRAVYHGLATGRPVSADELAATAGLPADQVAATLDGWPGVFLGPDRRVIGFWGLALSKMSHRFDVDGHTLFTWCAYDPLFIAAVLDRTARVTTRCPVSAETVTLTATPDGPRDVSPPGAVMSFLLPGDTWGENVIERFCHYVWLFASEAAGRRWVAEHPGTFLLSLDEAYELARRHLRLLGVPTTTTQ